MSNFLPQGPLKRTLTLYISLFILFVLLGYSVFIKFYLAQPERNSTLKTHLYGYFEKELSKKLGRQITPSQIDFILNQNSARELFVSVTVWEKNRPIYDLNKARYQKIRKGKELPELKELYQKITEESASKVDAKIFTLHRGKTEYLFSISAAKKDRRIQNGLVMFAGVVTTTLFIFIFIYILAQKTFKPLTQLNDSLEELVSNGHSEGIFHYPDNEIGEAITHYNTLLGRYEELSRNSSAYTEELFSDDTDQHIDVAQFLQKKLFERPFPRFKQIEVALYPRKPSYHSKEFLSVTGDGKALNLLQVHFDVHNIETLLAKHRLQEKFLTLNIDEPGAELVSRRLWESILSYIDFGPGFLFLQADPAEGVLRFYRSGPFALFLIKPGGETEHLEGGDSFFTREFDGISEFSIQTGDTLLIISAELLEIIGHTEDFFIKHVLTPAGEALSTPNAKKHLAETLKQLTQQGDITDFYGVINMVRFR